MRSIPTTRTPAAISRSSTPRSAPEPSAAEARRERLAIVAAALLAYAPGLGTPLQLDDALLADFHALSLHSVGPVKMFATPMFSSITGFSSFFSLPFAVQLPLTFLPGASFWLHGLSLFVHAVASLLVAEIARIVVGGRGAALAAGLVFALHPVHAQAILCLGWFPEPLVGLLSLASFYAFLRSGERPSWAYASVGAFALGLLCKEHILPLPAVFFWWQAVRPDSSRPISRLAAGYGVVAAAYCASSLFLAASFQASGLPAPVSAGSVAALAYLLRLLVAPTGLAFTHAWKGWAEWAPLGVCSLAFLAGACWLSRRRGRGEAASLGLLWLAATLWALGPWPFEYLRVYLARRFANERYLYAGSAGFAWLASAAYVSLSEDASKARRSWARRLPALAGTGALAALAAAAVAQDIVWSDRIANLESAAATEPSSFFAGYELGWAYLNQARSYRPAELAFLRVLELPNIDRFERASALIGRAVSEIGLRDRPRAERDLEASLNLYPRQSKAWGLLGALRLGQGREEEASRDLSTGLGLLALFSDGGQAVPPPESWARANVEYVLRFDPTLRPGPERLLRLEAALTGTHG